MVLYVELAKFSALKEIVSFIEESNIKLVDIETEAVENAGIASIAVIITIKFPYKVVHTELIKQINVIKGVIYAKEI